MTFESKTYPVSLEDVPSPAERALWIADRAHVAEHKLGKKPTHVLASKDLRLDIEILDQAGLRVKRMAFWSMHYVVRLAVEVTEVEPRARGGPARIPVQGRLV